MLSPLLFKELSKYFDHSTNTDIEMAFKITLKNIMESLNIFGENQDLLNSALNCVLILSKHNMWNDFFIKNKEGDYETINEDDCYEVMKSQEEDQKEPDYMNVKKSNYMDMNKGKPSFFAANTPIEKENEKAQQGESQVAPSICLN